MKDPIFSAGADYGRLAPFAANRVRRPCMGCNGLGYHEELDQRLAIVMCPHCRGLGSTYLPMPKQVRAKPVNLSDDDGERDDDRMKAALAAYQDAMKRMSTWRNAVRAAVKAAEAAGKRA